MGVMATFLRAIRAGVIHFQHSAILLAHYGRLGPSFDLCTKVIVDILREEGMYKNNGEAVVAVICQALREVSYRSSTSTMYSRIFYCYSHSHSFLTGLFIPRRIQ